jgi:hypothetical protein
MRSREESIATKTPKYKELLLIDYLSIIILNVNGLDFPIKRQRLADWFKKQEPTLHLLPTGHTPHWQR